MKRNMMRAVCFLFSCLLLLQALPLRATTAPAGVYMIAVDDNLMKVEQNTMPFWQEGRLYIPQSVFKGIYRETLGVSFATTVDGDTAILFTPAKALTFDLRAGTVVDNAQNPFSGAAKAKNGVVFFPIDLVTDYFGLSYTYSQTSLAPLIRIKSSKAVLSDARFIDAAQNLMQHYYREYEKTVESPVVTPPTRPVAVTGQRVYLVFTVTDAADTKMLAATLARYNMQATFLMTAEQMEAEGDLLRRLTGQKHAIGVLIDGKDAAIEEELANAREALWANAQTTSRLVWVGKDNADEVEALGYCAMSCLLSAATGARNSTSAETIYKRFSSINNDDLTVFLGTDVDNVGGLRYLLTKLEEGDCRVLAWRETL